MKSKNRRLIHFLLLIGLSLAASLGSLFWEHFSGTFSSDPMIYSARNPYVREISGPLHPAYTLMPRDHQTSTASSSLDSLNAHRFQLKRQRSRPSIPRGAIILKKTKLITLAVQSVPQNRRSRTKVRMNSVSKISQNQNKVRASGRKSLPSPKTANNISHSRSKGSSKKIKIAQQ